MKVIYIAGYGRSGSTLLDLLLGQVESVHSCGELVNFKFDIEDEINTCSCGEYINCCEYWDKISKSASQGKIKNNRDLFNAIEKLNNPEVMVDSSKTSYTAILRPIKIKKEIDQEVFICHLVKNPHDVVQSLRKGTNKSLSNGEGNKRIFCDLRGYIGWSIANFFALLNSLAFKEENRCLIRFEDLVTDPVDVVSKSFKTLKLSTNNLEKVLNGKAEQKSGHLYAGNRMAKKPLIIKHEKTQQEISLKRKLYRFVFCSIVEGMISVRYRK